jgi:hypothetical protein
MRAAGIFVIDGFRHLDFLTRNDIVNLAAASNEEKTCSSYRFRVDVPIIESRTFHTRI